MTEPTIPEIPIAELERAAVRLARNDDFKLFLTYIKTLCIKGLTANDATQEQLADEHRRFLLADDFEHMVKTHASRANSRTT